jgi:hypothetical protein|eukprot:CAMPEP_0198298416 /NCGR_PEP_ID=MMETSP1449-20131203/40866_1 /TAXON_ID=420275 /ORGANISM="Attheya septentrionalis, Strain CCMP2084" /LENGTH=54 /DNA_ID=CAMNT_0043999675 /DNA_START=642 /DNA_END=806 /DNA_ORIENTATION=-
MVGAALTAVVETGAERTPKGAIVLGLVKAEADAANSRSAGAVVRTMMNVLMVLK